MSLLLAVLWGALSRRTARGKRTGRTAVRESKLVQLGERQGRAWIRRVERGA